MLVFLFSDVEGGTRLWNQQPTDMRAALVRQDDIIEKCVDMFRGLLVRPRGEGDSRFAVFRSALGAVRAAVEIQRDLLAEAWPTTEAIRVRIAEHAGEADLRDGDYYGTAPNRCARMRSLACSQQVLVSEAAATLVRDDLPDDVSLRDLGPHRPKDLPGTEHIFQIPPYLPISHFCRNRRSSGRIYLSRPLHLLVARRSSPKSNACSTQRDS
jgi:class 3 adenylate cyclase